MESHYLYKAHLEQTEKRRIVRVAGELDISSADTLRSLAEDLDDRDFVLDLTAVTSKSPLGEAVCSQIETDMGCTVC